MDISVLHPFLDWVDQHPLWAGVALFVIAFVESLAFVGLIIPGVALMFGFGALIGAGILDLWSMVAWAAVGAALGDSLSYWLGRRYRTHLRDLWPFRSYPGMLARGTEFFRRYGGKSVIFGRFVGPVRGTIPLVAGMLEMHPGRFLLVELSSALAWAPAYLLPGVVFGASLDLASEVASRLAAVLLGLLLLLWLVAWLVRRSVAFVQPRANRILFHLLHWGRDHRWLGDLSAALADPAHPEGRALFLLGVSLLAGTWAFVWTVSTLGNGTPLSQLDLGIHQFFVALRTPPADRIMVELSQMAERPVLVPLIVAVAALLLWRRSLAALYHWLAAAAFADIASSILKRALAIPRPPESAAHISGYSFPSGHTLHAAVIYGFLAVLLARHLPLSRRWIPYTLAGLIAVGVGTSRLYLGAHWLSDVLGSLGLGLAWVALLGIAYRVHASPPLPRGLALVSVLTLVLAATLHSHWHYQRNLELYAFRPRALEMTTADWWESGWQTLAPCRNSWRRGGHQPMTLQWAGALEAVRSELIAIGWQEPPQASPRNLLLLLSSRPELDQLPLLPQFHSGQAEGIRLVRPGPNQDRRLVLRLWRASLDLTAPDQPLWVGNVSVQQLDSMRGLLSYPRTGRDFDAPLQTLVSELPGLEQRRVAREESVAERGARGPSWDGEVLLLIAHDSARQAGLDVP